MRPLTLVTLAFVAVLVVVWFGWRDVAPGQPPTANPAATLTPAGAPEPAATGTPTLDVAAKANEATLERRAVPTAADPTVFAIRGRAMRSADQPAPGALVRARAFIGPTATGAPAVEQMLTASANGNFVWELPAPTAVTHLKFQGVGERVSSSTKTFVLAPGDAPPPPFELRVVPLTAVVRGRVLDPDGRPIAGARVGTSSRGGSATSADGAFELFVEAKPTVKLYANAHRFVELRHDVAIDLATGEGACELRLRAGKRIHGRVTDGEQRPIAGATVRTFYTIFADGAETDADGRFVLDNLDPSLASHSVFARKDGYVEGKADVKMTADDVEQDLVLGRGVAVRGTIIGPQQKPVPAATVFVGFSPSAYDRLDTISDLDGTFVFPCVATGEHTLNVERAGLAGRRLKFVVPAAPSPPVVVRVELDAGHFVGGRTVTADGKPLAGVWVSPKLDGEYLDGIRGKTDAAGHFRLDGLPSQGLSLEFWGAGILRTQHAVQQVDRDDLEVRLERHGRMAGTVVDGKTRKPIPEFRIRFGTARLGPGETTGGGYSAEWVRGGRQFRDPAGVFRIDEGVQPGSVFALEASADGYGPSIDEHVVAVLEPDPAQTVIALYPGVAIDGVVLARATGLPVVGATVKAVPRGRQLQPDAPNDDVGRPIAETDARGVFRLANVGQGEVTLTVTHPDWLPVAHGPLTIQPEAVVPSQTIELDGGVVLQVDVRDAAGAPLAGAMVDLYGGGSTPRQVRSSDAGTARFSGTAPGEYQLTLHLPAAGSVSAAQFHRAVTVERQDCRIEVTAKDGDAALAVQIEGPAGLPDRVNLMVWPRDAALRGVFRGRGAIVHGDRNVISQLPAADLVVAVFAHPWQGTANVTTLAGQQVEVRIVLKEVEKNPR